MKFLPAILTSFGFLFLGSVPARAQLCGQTKEVGLNSSNVVFEAGFVFLTKNIHSTSVPGQIEIYEKSPASGVFELQQILMADPVLPGYWGFGSDMSTDGDTLVVSSENWNFPGERSAVYVFERNAGLQTWEQVVKIIPPASSFSHQFAGSVVVSEDQILIGAPLEGTGVVYVVERDSISGLWSYGQTIYPPAGTTPEWFGFVLDLDGDLLAVGDPGANGGTGMVHAFGRDPQTGTWTFARSLPGISLATDSSHGSAVAVQGNRVLAGAPGYGLGYGNAVLWERDPASGLWQVGFQYNNGFGLWNGNAGRSVALDGDDAYIAIPGTWGSTGLIQKYRYDPISSNWILQLPIVLPALPVGFAWASIAGRGLGSLDGVLVFAAHYVDNLTITNIGARLYFMGDSDQDCDGNGFVDLCEISNGTGVDLNDNGLLDICESIGLPYCRPTTLNSAGEKGLLSVDGSLFVQENNVTLRTTQLPPNQFGYALNSPYQGVIANPGGSQGNLCIFGPSLGRHNRAGEVRYSGAAGEFDVIIDLTSFPSPMGAIMVQAGESWNFQVWHRDQNPGNTSNLTNAVSLTFQ